MDDFEQLLREAEQRVAAAAVEGVGEAGDALLSDSRDAAPYDQGDLSRSGKVTAQATSAGAESAVSYDTPYAVRQHEDTTLRHDGNGQANYLGGPLRKGAQRYLEHVADKVRDALGG